MVFSSVVFLHYFLPITLLAFLVAYRSFGLAVSNGVLLVASLVFYMWGIGASFIGILLISITLNYFLGMLAGYGKDKGDKNIQRLSILLCVLLNIGLLAYYKYANFFVGEFNHVLSAFGGTPVAWTSIVLPIGISFFTFQSMSYTFDVIDGSAKVMRNPFSFALYVALFPQLIAGPIVRFHLVDKQIKKRIVSVDGFKDGVIRFTHGLAKKVLIADSAGAVADSAFLLHGSVSAGTAWMGALAYTVQIYFDFSAYSDMAIGMGKMFGFKFPENFNRPYSSLSITDFWRRWHMTLSSWFRDYLYIPLGGSRVSKVRLYANLWIVFLTTGLWHGASFTFVIWGGYHGALLILERLTNNRMTSAPNPYAASVLLRRGIVMLLVIIGWVIFRAQTLDQSMGFLKAMFFSWDWSLDASLAAPLQFQSVLIIMLGMATVFLPSWFNGKSLYVSSNPGRWKYIIVLMGLALPLTIFRIASGTYSPFLYFQF